MTPIYLDHNATTPIHPEVVEAMRQALAAGYANPASQHRPGQLARKTLEDARERIAALLGADLTCPQPDRLVFTASATEANNLAVLGIGLARGPGPAQVVVSAIEHPSVLGPAEHLLECGWRLDTLGVTPDGVVRVEMLPPLLSQQTRVVSVMLANHDTGVCQPVAELAEICNARGIPLHTDAVQVAGKLPIDFRRLGVAALSVGAHKFRGPLGIGALLLRHDVAIKPLMFGGHQQAGLRPGTEAIALAIGMLTALEVWQREHVAHARRLAQLRERFEQGLRAKIPGLVVHADGAPRLPQTANIAFPGVDGQVLLIALSTCGVACSAGSACASGSVEVSPTLRAMGASGDLAGRSLRFSLGGTTTDAEIEEAVARIAHVWTEIRC